MLVNYVVPKEVLLPYVPKHTELDINDGKCYASLVGFMFKDTRLCGIPIPFHRDFEEVNLRFYVKHHDVSTWKRGVVFIKEIVPKKALTAVANILYKEHYQTLEMKHSWNVGDQHQEVAYMWSSGNEWHSMRVSAKLYPTDLLPGSHEEFMAEHYWGYTKVSNETTYEYEVSHPKWQVYPVQQVDVQVDFAAVYGQHFGFLNKIAPHSTILAEGSEIAVKAKKKLSL